jgi:arylsulfatase A-like enzyme
MNTGSFKWLIVVWILFFEVTHTYCRQIKEDRPNIIFIMADDLGYGDIGCYGQKLIQTPHIDKLAQSGTRFTNVYAGAPVCAPSRSVLMTGQHTGHTRVRENSGYTGGAPDEMEGGGHRIPLLDEDVTVAEILKEAGYVTGITGKWGLGESGTSGVPNKQGFDEWYGYLNQNHAVFFYTDYLWLNNQRDSIPDNRNNQQKVYTHDLMTDFALDFIQRHREKPFFLFIPYTIPHFNIEVPELEEYTKDKDWPESAKIYASMVTRMDRDVGRIMRLINQLGIDRNTLVFFTSDNGPDYGKGAEMGDALFNSNGPFKGSKGSLHEGGIRVPMIANWTGKIPAGRVSNAAWYFADIMPTLAELAGGRCPEKTDGISILRVLTGSGQDMFRRFMYWEKPARRYADFKQAVRYGKWKALRAGAEQSLELFDLEKDPGEKFDVASRNQEIVSFIENYLKTARTDSPFWPME